MKKFALIAILVACATYFATGTAAESKEKAAVEKTLNYYLMGHKTGKAEYMKKAFFSEGKLMYVREGKYTTREFSDYISRMGGKPAKNEADRKRYIESVDIAGNAAVGKIVLDYPHAKFIDYMSMLKINGEWKIVNKSFHVEPK